MASLVSGVGLVLLVVGILTVAAALGLLVFSQDDAQTQGHGVLAEPDRAGGHGGSRIGQTVAVAGGALAFLGLVCIVIGRGDEAV